MPVQLVETAYEVGDRVKVTCRFQDPVTQAYVDPAAAGGTVTAEVMDPGGSLSNPTPNYSATLETLQPDGTTLTAPGYYIEIDVEVWGQWYYRFAATGTYQAADEGSFYVERSKFA